MTTPLVVLVIAAALLVYAALRLAAITDALVRAVNRLAQIEEQPCCTVAPRLLSVREAAVYLGVSPDDVLDLERKGCVRRVPRTELFDRQQLDRSLGLGLN